MQLTKLATVFFALIVRVCFAANIILTRRPVEIPEVVDATVNLITSCYESKGKAVAIDGKVPDSFIMKLWSKDHFPVVLIDNGSPGEGYHISLRSKLWIFVFVASTNEELRKRLVPIVRTPWHNHMASFIVPDWSPHTIYKFEEISHRLDSFYEGKMYNARIVSLDPESKTVKIYGYNPHTNYAPKPWKRINTHPNDRHGNFTILMREQRQNEEENCENQDFDKTIDVGGDQIEVFVQSAMKPTSNGEWEAAYKGVNELNRKDSMWTMVKTFVSHVNAEMRMVDEEQIGAFQRIRIGDIKDLTVVLCFQTPELSYYLTYPVFNDGEFIITQQRGHRTQLSKILGVIDFNSQISLCVVLFLTLLFFKFFVRQAIAPAFLNILRITSNTGFTNLPRTETSRMYLAALFIFVVTMQGIFTGNLSSLLTYDMPLPNPNTLQDLVDYGYTIYTSAMNVHYFTDPIFDGRVVAINNTYLCVHAVLRDPMIACVETEVYVKDAAMQHDFHISKDPIAKHHSGLIAAIHWPFLEKFDKIVRVMTEADVISSLNMRVKVKRFNEAREERMNYHEPKVMTLDNLGFAFVILAIGCALGTVSFILELAINRTKTRKTKVHSLKV